MASKTDTGLESADRPRLHAHQLASLDATLRRVLSSDGLFAIRSRQAGVQAAEDVRSLNDLQQLPLTTRDDLVADQNAHPPYGTHRGDSVAVAVRASRSPGTAGQPLRRLDTRESLADLSNAWQTLLRGAGVRAGDRIVHAAQPPWLGSVAAAQVLRTLSIVESDAGAERLVRELVDTAATVLICTPTQALHAAQASSASGIDLREAAVRLVIVGGEPGGCVPSTKRRIEERFGAVCVDTYTVFELGPVGWGCAAQPSGLHLDESRFICEAIDPATGEGVARGDMGELVVTSLAADAAPFLRYRTGDLVRLDDTPCACGRTYIRVVGGVLGRSADLLVVRGVAVLPALVENVVRRHPAVVEYRLNAYEVRGACEVAVDVEPDAAIATEGDRARVAAEIAEDVRRSLGLRLQCEAVHAGRLSSTAARPRRLAWKTSARRPT